MVLLLFFSNISSADIDDFLRLQIVRQSGPKDVWQNQDFPINLRIPRGQWNFKYQINQCDPSDVCTNGGSQRFLNHDLEMETI